MARDQGRVVFFCGAGVSRHKAKLDDFHSLTGKIITDLGVDELDRVAKIYKKICELIDDDEDYGSLISSDRLFGHLEQDYDLNLINEYIAKYLKVDSKTDASAHKILLELATGQDGICRLVTTNFDHLFSLDNGSLKEHVFPKLPDLNKEELEGIVYLHGKLNAEQTGAEGGRFILSSSSFGEAYLSNAWASNFIKDVLKQYVVVLVGYTADDPPMQYLLEGISAKENTHRIYAFQSGGRESAKRKWRAKGVEPIHFDAGFDSLWNTLSLWKKRAEDKTKWYESRFEMAEKGPAKLDSYERGQIAQIISTREGAKILAKRNKPIPASWLFVFDKSLRLKKPVSTPGVIEPGGSYDSSFHFGIDTDPTSEVLWLDNSTIENEILTNCWSAFEINHKDRLESGNNSISNLFTTGSYPGSLPSRLDYIAEWFSKLTDDPIALWWLAGKRGIHAGFIEKIKRKLDKEIFSILGEYWQIDLKKIERPHFNHEVFNFNDNYERKGWSDSLYFQLEELLKPNVVVAREASDQQIVSCDFSIPLERLCRLDIECSNHLNNLTVNIEAALPIYIESIERYIKCQLVVSDYRARLYGSVKSIISSNADYFNPDDTYYNIIIGSINTIIKENPMNQIALWNRWASNNGQIYKKLLLWLLDFKVICDINLNAYFSDNLDEFIWENYFHDEIITKIKDKWNFLDEHNRRMISDAILKGPDWFDNNEEDKEGKSRSIIKLLFYFKEAGIELDDVKDGYIDVLIEKTPSWLEVNGKEEINSAESKSDDGFSLDGIEISQVVNVINRNNKNSYHKFNKNPWGILIEKRPIKALFVLVSGRAPEWMWVELLQAGINVKYISPILITKILMDSFEKLEFEKRKNIINPLFRYMRGSIASSYFLDDYFSLTIVSRLIRQLENTPVLGRSTINFSEYKPDNIVSETNNSPIGILYTGILDIYRSEAASKNCNSLHFLNDIEERLFKLGGMNRKIIVFLMARYSSYFYDLRRNLVEEIIFPKIINAIEEDAVLIGLAYSSRTIHPKLFNSIKLNILEILKSGNVFKEVEGSVVRLFKDSWLLGEVEDKYFRNAILDSSNNTRVNLVRSIRNSILNGNITSLDRVEVLFGEVWPKNKSIRTNELSSSFADLVLSVCEVNPKIFELVNGFMSQSNDMRIQSLEFHSRIDMSKKFPALFIKVMYIVLADDPSNWPYYANEVLMDIHENNMPLRNNEKLIELLKRFNDSE